MEKLLLKEMLYLNENDVYIKGGYSVKNSEEIEILHFIDEDSNDNTSNINDNQNNEVLTNDKSISSYSSKKNLDEPIMVVPDIGNSNQELQSINNKILSDEYILEHEPIIVVPNISSNSSENQFLDKINSDKDASNNLELSFTNPNIYDNNIENVSKNSKEKKDVLSCFQEDSFTINSVANKNCVIKNNLINTKYVFNIVLKLLCATSMFIIAFMFFTKPSSIDNSNNLLASVSSNSWKNSGVFNKIISCIFVLVGLIIIIREIILIKKSMDKKVKVMEG